MKQGDSHCRGHRKAFSKQCEVAWGPSNAAGAAIHVTGKSACTKEQGMGLRSLQ